MKLISIAFSIVEEFKNNKYMMRNLLRYTFKSDVFSIKMYKKVILISYINYLVICSRDRTSSKVSPNSELNGLVNRSVLEQVDSA